LLIPNPEVVCENLTLPTAQKAHGSLRSGGGGSMSLWAAVDQRKLGILLKYKGNEWCKKYREMLVEKLL